MEARHAIRPLSPEIIGKIAAGEVVERPAFAVKELVENSIDAGATAVTVEIRDGGLTYFRVTDNGRGIDPQDIRMAFARHATSKLHGAEDLFAIHTLGFRGEALASIAAVARVELRTRRMGSEGGVKALAAGGMIESIQEAPSPEGTAVTVRDLFFNTPARRKFLKTPATESGLVSDLVMRLILARPDISFRLRSGDRQVYHSPGNGSLKDALFCVLGREALDSLTEVSGSAAGCAVAGYVGAGEAARGSRAMQTFILNGRYVRSPLLSKALEEGCRERVMVGKYPVCALHLTMPFEAVDVNVHPNKLEVRFQDERALAAGLSGIVFRAFAVDPLTAAPTLSLGGAKGGEAPAEVASQESPGIALDSPAFLANRPPVVLRDGAAMPAPAVNRPPVFPFEAGDSAAGASAPPPGEEQLSLPQTDVPPPLRILGVAWREYIVAEQEDALYLIDQHAAHERILYERFTASLGRETVSQPLLAPYVAQLTHREHTALLENLDDLKAAGFDLEDYGDRSVQVRAVPRVLGAPLLQAFLGGLADSQAEYRALPSGEKRRDMLVKLACRKAVKAGDPLPPESVAGLIAQMRETGAPPTCPHGRPLVVRISKTDLDKRFRRIV